MNNITSNEKGNPDGSLSKDKKDFFPKGAVAFFVGMIGFFAVVWLGIYALMIYQQGNL